MPDTSPSPEQIAEWRAALAIHRGHAPFLIAPWDMTALLDALEASEKRRERAERALKILESEAMEEPLLLWSGIGSFPNHRPSRGLSIAEGLAAKIEKCWRSAFTDTQENPNAKS